MIAQEDLVANILTKTVLSLTQWSTTSKLEHQIARLSVFLNKYLVKIADAFKTTSTSFLYNFLSIPYISDIFKQCFFKYFYSNFILCPPFFWPSAILNFYSNTVYIPLSSFYSNHLTFFVKSLICKLPPSSSPLSDSFPSHFNIFNKARIKSKNRDKLIKEINQSLYHSPNTLFFFIDGSATLTSLVIHRDNKLF